MAYLRPMVTYACSIWATTTGNENRLNNFERKVLRIYGLKYNPNTQGWERKTNEQLNKITEKEILLNL